MSLRSTSNPSATVIDWSAFQGEGWTGWRGADSSDSLVEAWILGTQIQRWKPPRCPICSSGDNPTKEHVPPESIGGVHLTWTCKPCNSDLGSKVDEPLRQWSRFSFPRATIELDGLPGRRRIGEFGLGRTRQGKPALILAGLERSVSENIGGSSSLRLSFQAEPLLYRSGLLKSAYLAVCAAANRVPLGPTSDAVRHDLVAARDGSLILDERSDTASSLKALHIDCPKPIEPRIAVFFDSFEKVWRVGVGMSKHVAYGPSVTGLISEGLTGKRMVAEQWSGEIPPDFNVH